MVKKSIDRLFQKFDIYGESIGFKIEGKDTYQSAVGGVLSLITLSLLLAFTVVKTSAMWERDDTVHQNYIRINALDSTAVYTDEDLGFNAVIMV